MKHANFFICIVTLLLVYTFNLEAQSTWQIDASTKGYVQSSTKMNDSIELCTLCKDKTLKSGCSSYLINSKTRNVMPVTLTKTQLTDLLSGKQTATISGLKSVGGSAPGYYYYENGTNTTTVYKAVNGKVLLLSFTNTSPSSPTRSVERVRTPAELQKLNDCLDFADKMCRYCYAHALTNKDNDTCHENYVAAKLECVDASASLAGFTGGISIQIGVAETPTTIKK